MVAKKEDKTVLRNWRATMEHSWQQQWHRQKRDWKTEGVNKTNGRKVNKISIKRS